MPRIMTDDRRKQIAEAASNDPSALGPKLGMYVLGSNVPVDVVSEMIGASTVSIYRWMYGEYVPSMASHVHRLARLVAALDRAKAAGDLPVEGTGKRRRDPFIKVVQRHK